MRFIKVLVVAVALAASVACGGGKGGGGGGGGTGPKVDASAVVELGEMTLFEGDQPVFKVHADGKTEIEGKPGPTIKTDGTIEHEGKALARINADGTIFDIGSNTKLPVTLGPDKFTIEFQGKQMGMSIADNGALTLFGAEEGGPDKPIRVEGADTPGKRRTILAVVALVMMPGEKMEDSGPVPAQPDPLAPPSK
jgi:hypothetical protein